MAGSDRKRSVLQLLGVTCLLLAAGWSSAAATGNPDPQEISFVGKTLTEALLELQSRGLKLVFTSQVVRPEMRVLAEPVSSVPRQILDELLNPFGLVAREGPDGTVVVVRQAAQPIEGESSLGGSVLSRRRGVPLAGVVVRILESASEVKTAEDGSFVFVDPGSGPLTLEATAPGYLAERMERILVPAGEHVAVALFLVAIPVIEEEMVVTPSRLSLLREEPVAPLGLSREDILVLPHLGDDFFRALSLLPGATANDVSAQFHVRGGRRDETLILIDGQELYDAYHLKDFDSALSFVAPATLGSADLTTGGFAPEYGDRMSGVLDMTTVKPTGRPRFRVGAGILGAQLGSTGTFLEGKGSWVAEIRRGSIDLVGQLLGDEDPNYWDAFAKLDYQLSPRNSVRGNLIHSADELDFEKVIQEERNRLETDYESTYLWLTHQAVLSADALLETAVSVARVERDRRGLELEDDAQFTILDQRDLDVMGFRQAWHLELGSKHWLNWGWELRDFDSDFDYFGLRLLDNPLAQIRHDFGEEQTVFRHSFAEQHNSAYIADRFRLADSLTVALGLRYDRHTQTDESHLSPRFNLALALTESSILRIAWGRFNQSQRPYELQVEDGETGFYPVERSEHRVLGFEQLFGVGSKRPPIALRVEVYQRAVKDPRRRYENLFEPINAFPEVEPDRVLIAPDRSLAQGVELFLRGTLGQRLGWWATYTFASTEDRIDGTWVPRLFDETHSLGLDLDYRIGERWRINLAWRYHTGWPTTPLSLQTAENEDGETVFVPVLGPINSNRLPDYHRLDLRASRRWQLDRLAVDFFVDVQNVYDRQNLGGFDIAIDEEEGTIEFNNEAWPGFLPSAGISIEF